MSGLAILALVVISVVYLAGAFRPSRPAAAPTRKEARDAA
jgi:hypothetical protein